MDSQCLEEAFWKFVDQKWRDSLNMAVAELVAMDYSREQEDDGRL
jgi:hypothetical protein